MGVYIGEITRKRVRLTNFSGYNSNIYNILQITTKHLRKQFAIDTLFDKMYNYAKIEKIVNIISMEWLIKEEFSV